MGGSHSVHGKEQRKIAVAKLAKFLGKVVPLAFCIIRVEDHFFSPRIPALYALADIERGIGTHGEWVQETHVVSLDLLSKKAGLCYEQLTRARAYTALVLPSSFYAKYLEDDHCCLPAMTTDIYECCTKMNPYEPSSTSPEDEWRSSTLDNLFLLMPSKIASKPRTGRATERQKHLRNLKDVRIIMALEDIPYDVLIHTSRQRSADRIGWHKSPERGSRIAQGYRWFK
jgi:hypothetical protein